MSARLGPAFIGALSFEERASFAFERLAETSGYREAVFLDYGSAATPGEIATELREASWVRVSRAASAHRVRAVRRRVNPYAMGDVERQVRAQMQAGMALTIDVSCMTRPHVLGAAAACASAGGTREWGLAYTRPWSYGELDKPGASLGWRDSLLLSLAEDPSFSNEGLAIGIFLPGNESDRAAVAFDTIEPASGVIVGVRQPDRPDIYRLTAARNLVQTKHLLNLRMPGPRGEMMAKAYPFGRWVREEIDAGKLVMEITRVVHAVVQAALKWDAPVILYPFGPKVAVFVATFALASTYAQGSWAVYPVPRTHPLDYSDGARTMVAASGVEIAAAAGLSTQPG